MVNSLLLLKITFVSFPISSIIGCEAKLIEFCSFLLEYCKLLRRSCFIHVKFHYIQILWRTHVSKSSKFTTTLRLSLLNPWDISKNLLIHRVENIKTKFIGSKFLLKIMEVFFVCQEFYFFVINRNFLCSLLWQLTGGRI